ncbi:hypothetical protein [Streptomyces sp. BBFR102]|uniref:hypothetical protein n=1 Tax=Streptomyces sp. BBFR102 TaxID=3448171 RepID=UPI003F53D6C8
MDRSTAAPAAETAAPAAERVPTTASGPGVPGIAPGSFALAPSSSVPEAALRARSAARVPHADRTGISAVPVRESAAVRTDAGQAGRRATGVRV